MTYFFILGRNPTLSVAELLAFFTHRHIPHQINKISKEVCLIKTEERLGVNILQQLGGSVKFGSVLQEINLEEKASEFEHILSGDFLSEHLPTNPGGKMHLGISVYTAGAEKKDVAQLEKQLKYLNKTVKTNLQEKGIKVGFVQIKERYLSSVSVFKNELLTKGIELVLMLSKDTLIIGKTLAVQEFESFSFRDMGRPEKDKRSGILPPKLARIMINLARVGTQTTLYDPFCGSGTIVQEAIILGFKRITGSDISSKAVADTQKNIDWLYSRFRGFDRSLANIHIFQADVHTVSEKINHVSLDAIVTEPYLGPPLFKKPDEGTIKKILGNIALLYRNAFSQFAKILKKDGRVVIVFPCFELNGSVHFLEIEDKIKQCGFRIVPLIPEEIKNEIVTEYTARCSILYGGKEQFVKREIRSFEKIK